MPFDSDKTLRIRWGKREGWLHDYPSKYAGYAASDLTVGISNFPEFINRLHELGFDISSLKLSIHRRSFRCIQNIHSFAAGESYYLCSTDKDRMQMVSSDGFMFTFAHRKGEPYPVHSQFFVENKK